MGDTHPQNEIEHKIRKITACQDPPIYLFPDFLMDHEVDHLIKVSEQPMFSWERSWVGVRDKVYNICEILNCWNVCVCVCVCVLKLHLKCVC